MRDAGKLASATVSGIEMIETIKASGAENGFFQRWSGLNASVNGADVDAAQLESGSGALLQALSGLAGIAVLLLGAALILYGRFTAGNAVGISVVSDFLHGAGRVPAFSGPADAGNARFDGACGGC